MDLVKELNARLSGLDPRLLSFVERALQRIPGVKGRIDRETDAMLGELESSLKPYKQQLQTFAQLPWEGRPRTEVLSELEELARREEPRWKEGFVSGGVYQGKEDHIRFLNQVYALSSQVNPLHADLWPSANKFETEIISMTARMLNAGESAGTGEDEVCGSVTSGGTESILMAMKAYRDWARAERGITRPEILAPVSAHAAFDKAAGYFRMKLRKIPLGPDYRADVGAAKTLVNRNTVVIVGSAPGFPHGVIDPIEQLSELALQRGIGFHTDACLGGFLLPWAQRLGYPVPAFDFALPGVTSLSCDTHKYGYAAKGTSVVLYRTEGLRHHQFFTVSDWPGGLYFSPTLAGSRPGALIAACWAALVTTGEKGYLDSARQILESAQRIKDGIRKIPELRLLGDPLFVIAFASEQVDIFRVLDAMAHRKWNLNGLHKPAAVHLCVTLPHTQPGVVDRFLEDLRASVAEVKTQPPSKGGMAPAYGMAASLPLRGVVSELLLKYMDRLYRL